MRYIILIGILALVLVSGCSSNQFEMKPIYVAMDNSDEVYNGSRPNHSVEMKLMIPYGEFNYCKFIFSEDVLIASNCSVEVTTIINSSRQGSRFIPGLNISELRTYNGTLYDSTQDLGSKE